MEEHRGAWKKSRQRSDKSERVENVTGCLGCLGFLVAFAAMLGVTAFSAGYLWRLGGGLEDHLQWFYLACSGLFGEAGALLLSSLAILLLGLLLVLVGNWRPVKRFRAQQAALHHNTESAFDQGLIQRHAKARKLSLRIGLPGLVLFIAPLLVIPFLGLALDNVDYALSQNVTAEEWYSIFLMLPLGLSMIGIVLVVIAFLVLFGYPTIRFRPAELSKEEVLRSELRQLFTEVEYRHNQGLPQQLVAATGLVANGNTYRGNDLIRGRYRGLAFAQSDLHLSQVVQREYRDKEGHRQTETVRTEYFSGRWLCVTLPEKSIGSDFYILSKRFPKHNLKAQRQGRQQVELEDVAFNRFFDCYAAVPHDLFYILTPALIQRLKELADLEEGQAGLREGLGLYCRGNQLHLAISGLPDAFEHIFLGATSEQEVRQRVRKDLAVILDLLQTIVG